MLDGYFFSYARGDKARIEPLVNALEDQNWVVWWDTDLLPGNRFHDIVSAQLESARCVVVVWSKLSVKSDWVPGEAETAKDAGKLIPVRLDTKRDVPLNFLSIHTEDFSNWSGNRNAPEFVRLCNAIRTKLGTPEKPLPIVTPSDHQPKQAPVSDDRPQRAPASPIPLEAKQSDGEMDSGANVDSDKRGPRLLEPKETWKRFRGRVMPLALVVLALAAFSGIGWLTWSKRPVVPPEVSSQVASTDDPPPAALTDLDLHSH